MPWNRNLKSLWQVNKFLWMTLGIVFLYALSAQSRGLFLVSPLWAWLLFLLGVVNTSARSYFVFRTQTHPSLPKLPGERTYLTTGILAYSMDSHFQNGIKIETPDLNIAYRPMQTPAQWKEVMR